MGKNKITTSMIMQYIMEAKLEVKILSDNQDRDNKLRNKLGFKINYPKSDGPYSFLINKFQFIPEKKWGKVLKKYNLQEGDFISYTHFIPHKILKELSNHIDGITSRKYYVDCQFMRNLGNYHSELYTKEECLTWIKQNSFMDINWFGNKSIETGSVYYDFLIAAPSSHFDKKSLKEEDKLNLDPIVTLKIPQGRFIIKAWDVDKTETEI